MAAQGNPNVSGIEGVDTASDPASQAAAMAAQVLQSMRAA
jgi:hypothetical protein